MSQYIDLTLETPEKNLAFDEALLNHCEEGFGQEILRVWEPSEYFVVTGYSNQMKTEVNMPHCQTHGVPVLRRLSGGGTVLQGPGCFNFTLILKIEESGPLKNTVETNAFVMNRHCEAMKPHLDSNVRIQGFTDLAFKNLKFSGNAQRRKRRFVLFHGTFLINFDIPKVTDHLHMPSKQPAYRENRTHEEFLTNVNLTSENLKEMLRNCWQAEKHFEHNLLEETNHLVQTKYSTDAWNFKY